MKGLLDIATVLRGDGTWTSGAENDSISCGRVIQNAGICDFGTIEEPTDSLTGYKVEPFSILASQKFGYRCGPEDYMPIMAKVLDDASEYQVTQVFWQGQAAVLGVWDGEVTLASPDVHLVTPGADINETLANVLDAAYDRHPEITPIVHMGWLTAMKLAAGLKNLELDYVVGPGYPANGLAVTGPVTVRLGSVEVTENQAVATNRFYVEGTRLASIDFDMCLAVRADQS